MHYEYEGVVVALAVRIKALRKARKWSQLTMVREYGYNLSYWQGIEKGRRMSLRTLVRVANTFGMTLSELVEGVEQSEDSAHGFDGEVLPGPDLGEAG